MKASRNAAAWTGHDCDHRHPWWQPIVMLAAMAAYGVVAVPLSWTARAAARARRTP